MKTGIENHVDWSAAATPSGERVGPGLSGRDKQRKAPQSRSNVMETLLGGKDLAAYEVGGSDPYNSTGRHFRR
jgi:hypothetical protein